MTDNKPVKPTAKPKSVFMFKIIESPPGEISIDFNGEVFEKPIDKLTLAEAGAMEVISVIQMYFKGELVPKSELPPPPPIVQADPKLKAIYDKIITGC